MEELRAGKVVITGGAGLVGQNLLVLLRERGVREITVIDKHAKNLALLRELHPEVTAIEADLARPGDWERALEGCEHLVLGQAQIGGLDRSVFVANNLTATEHVLRAARDHAVPFIVHLSSSVVNSMAEDFYTETKEAQEKRVLDSGLPCCVLRPTLMFGWFDRKHLGWLARFMRRVPVFPIPGHGRYLRQPLYAMDFCRIILACMAQRPEGEIYDITGLEKVDYIDLIRALRRATGAKARIVRVPYGLFAAMLRAYALVDRDPPFTVQQLEALVTPDVFDIIDWPGIFGVAPTPLARALDETFNDPRYKDIVLEF